MKNMNEYAKNLYLTDKYIVRHPSLFEEDSPWKVSKIIPLIDRFIGDINKDEINLLDVGGGAGLILNAVCAYIEGSYDIKVNRFSLDLSPGALEIQKKRNPDLKRALNEDICKTSLANKEIDLTLMIDVLEHVVNPIETLEELRRICRFVIFKVPLEDNLSSRIWDSMKKGKQTQDSIESGHINVYRFSKLKQQIEKHTGQVLDYYYTNAFYHIRNSKHHKKGMSRIGKFKNFVGAYLFQSSPRLCALIFEDFVMILVKCY